MTRDEVKEALRGWGHATKNRFALTKADRSTSVLASNLRTLPAKKRPEDERALIGRDGYARRARMAQSANALAKGLNLLAVPLWACDPIPARNDAGRPHDNPEAAVDMGIPDDLRWVDDAVRRIERQHPLRGLVLRTEYTISASQKVKARMVAETYGGQFSLAMYRRELDKAIDLIVWEGAKAA